MFDKLFSFHLIYLFKIKFHASYLFNRPGQMLMEITIGTTFVHGMSNAVRKIKYEKRLEDQSAFQFSISIILF